MEEMEGGEGAAKFSRDPWGCFLTEDDGSGGLARVLQGGKVIEKGACSFTCIRGGVLSAERAKTISARQTDVLVQAGDAYAAAALSSSVCTVSTFTSHDLALFQICDLLFASKLFTILN
jgi:coproporphyrinogen III oxidase